MWECGKLITLILQVFCKGAAMYVTINTESCIVSPLLISKLILAASSAWLAGLLVPNDKILILS